MTSTFGGLLRQAGEMEEAVSVLCDTFERARRVVPEDWPTWTAGHLLAVALAEQGRVHDAVGVGREVVAARRRLLGPDDPRSLKTAAILGETLRLDGQLEDAISLLSDTFERAKRVAGR